MGFSLPEMGRQRLKQVGGEEQEFDVECAESERAGTQVGILNRHLGV